MGLADLAQARLAMNLPTFPGASLAEQLVNGRNAALASLRKYVPDFSYDVAAADACIRHIDAWAERNNARLSQAMIETGNDLAAEIRVELGPGQAQAFILASFTKAAEGLGPWHSGAVDRIATTPGGQIGTVWAAEDAQQRLQTFGSIVRMDADGKLAEMFSAAAVGGGLGIAWLVPVLIATVLIAAIIVTAVVVDRRVQANNAIMRDLCAEAQRQGDKATVASCMEATRELQQTPFETLPSKLITVVAVLGALYIGVRYGLPWLETAFEKRKSHSGSAIEARV